MRIYVLAIWLWGCAAARATNFTVGTDQLEFVLNNGSTSFGCLDGIRAGGDPGAAGPRGVLVEGDAGATPLWQLTATACNESFPAATALLQSCTAVCARAYATASTDDSATLRWEGDAPRGESSWSRRRRGDDAADSTPRP